jgi:restriction system protein
MADTSWQRNGELLHALFDILRDQPEGVPAAQAIQAVADRVTLTDYEKGHYADGTRRFEKILRFSTITTVKAGWLVKEQGQWYVTDEGWQAHKKYKDPLEFVKRSVELYQVWKKAQGSGSPTPIPPIGEPPTGPELPSITLEKAEEEARVEIERHLKTMNPYEFQDLVAGLLRGMGYHVSWVAPPGKDDGIDIIAFSDPLGMRPPRIKVQVKRYDKPVPVGDVSAFLGNLGSEELGLFVSTGNFTKDAEAKVRNDKQHRVTLIGLDAFVRLWVQHYEKLDQTVKRRLPLQPVYFLALED